MGKYLDESKFVEKFEECLERQAERVLKADDDKIKEETELYLKYVDAYDKVSKTQNNFLIDESRMQLECEKFDKEFEHKRVVDEHNLELDFKRFLADQRKEVWRRIGTGVKIGLTAVAIGGSFVYETRGNIYSGRTSRGILDTLFRKPGDNLK